MHELSITEHLLEDCLREAKRQNASRIRVIRLCIGELRGIVPDCIQIYLDMLATGKIKFPRMVTDEVSLDDVVEKALDRKDRTGQLKILLNPSL